MSTKGPNAPDWAGLDPTKRLRAAVSDQHSDGPWHSWGKILGGAAAGIGIMALVAGITANAQGVLYFPLERIAALSSSSLFFSVVQLVIPTIKRTMAVSLETAVRRKAPVAMGKQISEKFSGGVSDNFLGAAWLAALVTATGLLGVGVAVLTGGFPLTLVTTTVAAISVVATTAIVGLTGLGIKEAHHSKNAAVAYAEQMRADTPVSQPPPTTLPSGFDVVTNRAIKPKPQPLQDLTRGGNQSKAASSNVIGRGSGEPLAAAVARAAEAGQHRGNSRGL